MQLPDLDDEKTKELISSIILSYHEDTNTLKYDSARKEFSILGLGSQADHMMARHAAMALGATDTFIIGGGKVVISEDDGAVKLAEKLKSLGLKFKGIDDLKSTEKSI